MTSTSIQAAPARAPLCLPWFAGWATQVKRGLLALAWLGAAGGAHAQATVYTATPAGTYTGKTDFTVCAVGPCQNFTLAMGHAGSFTTASPLAANLVNANVWASVSSFSFSDGLTTYSSTDPTVRAFRFQVSTNAGGMVTGADITLERWETGAAPHVVNDRLSILFLGLTESYHNIRCGTVDAGLTGVADNCTSANTDAGASTANGSSVTWSSALAAPAAAASIPTLSEWGLILMAAVMGGAGFAALRRRSA